MEPAPESRGSRREEIRQRLEAIHTRLKELRAKRQEDSQDDAAPAVFSERLASSQRYKAASQAAAEQAAAASARAFLRSAEAHQQAALQHERSAAAGYGDQDQHERQAATHRAAAVADLQRAERADSGLQEDLGDASGAHADPLLRAFARARSFRITTPPTYLAVSWLTIRCRQRPAGAAVGGTGPVPGPLGEEPVQVGEVERLGEVCVEPGGAAAFPVGGLGEP